MACSCITCSSTTLVRVPKIVNIYMSRYVPEKHFLVTAPVISRSTMQLFVSLLASVTVLAGLGSAAPAPASTNTHDKRSIVERAGVVYNVFEHAGWQYPHFYEERKLNVL
jgi:hypothetical protein